MEIFKLFGSILIDNSKANESLAKTDSKAQGLMTSMGKGVVAAAKWGAGIAAAAGTAIVAATKTAADFEAQMSNVATLLDGSDAQVSEKIARYGESIKQISVDTGASTGLLTDGLYQVVSAFGDVANGTQILETASKSAVAGNATVTDSVNLLSAVTKGYGDTSQEAVQKASDLAFQTVKLGQTSFPELAASMGKVIPLASTMKVSQEELFGAMATLTGVTGNTAEVTTQLRGTIQGLLQPTAAMASKIKELGYSNGQAMIESLGLQGTLVKLKESVNDDEIAFSALFGSVEAKNAVLALTGAQMDNFTEKTKAMYEAAGSTENAFIKQTDNLKGVLNKLKQAVNVAAVDLGEKFLPAFKSFAEWIISNLPAIQEVVAKAFNLISSGVSICVDYIAQLISAFQEWAVNNQDTVDEIMAFLGDLWSFLQEFFGSVIEVISAFIEMTMAFWSKYGDDILAVVKPLWEGIKTIISTVLEAVKTIFKVWSAIFQGDWETAWDGVKHLFVTVWEGIKNLVPQLLTALAKAFMTYYTVLFDIGKGLFESIWNGMKDIWNGIVSWVSDKVSWLVDKLAFWRRGSGEMDDDGGYDGSHATGLKYVPYDNYRANLHKGERVLTEREAREYERGGGAGGVTIGKLADTIIVREEADIDKIAAKLDEKIRRAKRERGIK